MSTALATSFACILLTPVEVVLGWDALFAKLKDSGLYREDGQIARLLGDGMQNKVQLWILKRSDTEGGRELSGVICTQIYDLPYTGVRTLSIIHATGGGIADGEWTEVYKRMLRYAQRMGCTRFEIFSDVERVQEIALNHGFRKAGLFIREI